MMVGGMGGALCRCPQPLLSHPSSASGRVRMSVGGRGPLGTDGGSGRTVCLSDRPTSAPRQHNRTFMSEPSFASVASHDGRRTMMVGLEAGGGLGFILARLCLPASTKANSKYEGNAVFAS